ncbi:MAG: TIGR00289 family protein [Thermoplasmata archaeon]|nr:MAG: TIGR00289 family protein [Thermoplasmata archaeon]
MRLASLISGGKDSLYATYVMSKKHDIVCLLSMFPERDDSYMFHFPNVKITELQAKAMGIPIFTQTTKAEKERELEDLKKLFLKVKDRVDGIVSGALASRYQKERIDKICREVGLRSFSPLWGIEPEKLWERLLSEGFEVLIISVSAMGLGKEWLGRKVDREAFEELKEIARKNRFHLGFEGGEAETLVVDMPLFRKKIKINKAEVVWYGDHGRYIIKDAELVEKTNQPS